MKKRKYILKKVIRFQGINKMIRITMIRDSDNSCSNCYLNNMCSELYVLEFNAINVQEN